ncbi:MAG: hypothetical protein Kapaf2KO_14700 [Candidatus Kapaibacteriales bacterium]
MKKGIHPQYRTVEVVMTDGSTFQTRSCYKDDRMVLEIDSKSHPFFTGKQMLVDTAGRVDRFKKRMARSQNIMKGRKAGTETNQENNQETNTAEAN